MSTWNQESRTLPKARTALIVTALFALSACALLAQDLKLHYIAVNVADSTQGLGRFSNFPAINNRGTIAFVATRNSDGQGVFKWEDGAIRTIASTGSLNSFGDDVVINASGVVGYEANVSGAANDRAMFTRDGSRTRLIVDANQQGLIGRFLGSPSINASGTVAFLAFRKNFSLAVFTGNGGALTTLADTTGGTFSGFGNAAINQRGQVTFPGTREDGSQGVFIATPVEDERSDDAGLGGPAVISPISDPRNQLFADPFATFGDPVINDAGVVGDAGFPGSGGTEMFTGNRHGVTARTDPENPFFFIEPEHPSLNNRGVLAFFSKEAGGGQGIFVEQSGGASPAAVIEAGDTLFGSIVTGVDLGRFGLNDRGQLAIHYELEDGRSGVALLSPKGASER